MTRRQVLYVVLAILLVIGVGVGVYWYYSSHSTPSQQESPTTSEQTPGTSTPSANGSEGDNTPVNKTYPISVYFSKHPQSDDDPSLTFPVPRTSPDSGVGTFAITELLKGPAAAEGSQGYFTTARLRSGTSTCSDKDFRLTVANGVATLQFCKPFDHLGSVADGQAESEIKASLLQFSTVQKVVILNSTGNCEFNLSGLNLCKE